MNNLPLPLSGLEEKIGYTFKNKNLLKRALSHSSYANEMRSKGFEVIDYERMEYLGDSVLSLVTSEYLFYNHPEMPEGELSKVRAAAVCEKALYEFAQTIELGKYLLLGHGEDLNGGRTRPSILADVFEAILAAIHLDSGIPEVKRFLLPYIDKRIKQIIEDGSSKDYKTLLQQIVQQEQGEILQYVTVGESGPSHQRIFDVEARLNSNVIGKGRGSSKREAEQMAAKEALTLFGEGK
ncbi:MAG: ribonuclease III [Ruminococcaceae bacterium]|nr:ribonuclease III [Oscillospiraceae bacterium]